MNIYFVCINLYTSVNWLPNSGNAIICASMETTSTVAPREIDF